jgi:hypothetical protein
VAVAAAHAVGRCKSGGGERQALKEVMGRAGACWDAIV